MGGIRSLRSMFADRPASRPVWMARSRSLALLADPRAFDEPRAFWFERGFDREMSTAADEAWRTRSDDARDDDDLMFSRAIVGFLQSATRVIELADACSAERVPAATDMPQIFFVPSGARAVRRSSRDDSRESSCFIVRSRSSHASP